MKSTGRVVVLFLLTMLIAGCRHRAKVTPPPAALAPVLPVYLSEANLPPPQIPPPQLPQVNPPSLPPPEHKPKKRRPIRRPVRHTEVPAEQKPDTNAELAANGGDSDMTPIGQLTAAGESTNSLRRNQILDEIKATQKGLDDLKRPFSKEEQNTANQIRTFLTKARQALDEQDLDGANILVTKARVLLSELTK